MAGAIARAWIWEREAALSITCTLWTDADPVDLHFAVQADYQTFPALQSAGFRRSVRSGLTCTVISGVLTSKRRELATLAAMRLAFSPASRSKLLREMFQLFPAGAAVRKKTFHLIFVQ